jgi:serine/threonine protein kinase
LRLLQENAGAQGKHLPRVLDQFRSAEGRLGTALEALDGYTLAQLRQRFPAGVEPRHVLWIFRRCLSALGLAHGKGILHAHLTPDHVLVRPSDHNLWLLDWGVAIHRPAETGETFRAIDPLYSPPEARRGQPPLPASDLYALARCMIFTLGGDPARETLPPATPAPLERLIRALLKESSVQRPQDAWELYQTLDTIREELYGPHRFIEFVVE